MSNDITIKNLAMPQLRFGGEFTTSDPKRGLAKAGPFDLNYGQGRKSRIRIGIIGPQEMIDLARFWIKRCMEPIPALREMNPVSLKFPGFQQAFHSVLVTDDSWTVQLDGETGDELGSALAESDRFCRFERVLDAYANALDSLASQGESGPDIVILAMSDEVLDKAGLVGEKETLEEREAVENIRRAQLSNQLDMFDLTEEVAQIEEEFFNRDLTHALKARALKAKLPAQIFTSSLLEDRERWEDEATQAWNFSVAVHYKSGGVPWLFPRSAPETCYVGMSPYYFQTEERGIAWSIIAKAMSSNGVAFAIRGEGGRIERGQTPSACLSEEQAYNFANRLMAEYRARRAWDPIRVVIQKMTPFDEAEIAGIKAAMKYIPVVELVTLEPSMLLLLGLGEYPPNAGSILTLDNVRMFMFTHGVLHKYGVYPGSNVPHSFEITMRSDGDVIEAAQDAYSLARMNMHTADICVKWPVTFSLSRRVGGIFREYGQEDPDQTALRFYI